MVSVKCLLGGLAGGFVGGLIWVLLGYFAHAEVGYVAWGIGFLVGAGVRYGGYLSEKEEGAVEGIFSAGLAVAVIVGSKFVVHMLLVGGAASEIDSMLSASLQWPPGDKVYILDLAEALVLEKASKGAQLKWPPGKNLESAMEEADFPPGIWKQAEQKWKGLPEATKTEMAASKKQEYDNVRQAVRNTMPSFWESFSLMDGLWIALAIFTAFQIGAGTYGSDD
jgi:hypothetical protein